MANKKRADGRYLSRVYLGDGKYKSVYARTQKELQEKVQAVKISLNKGIDLSAERDTFGEWAAQWLSLKYSEVSWGRYVSYKASIEHFDCFSDTPIAKLRPIDFQGRFFQLENEGFAAATIDNCKSSVKQVCDLAVANRVLEYNPVTLAKIPRGAAKTTRRALTSDEIQWFIDTPHRAQTAAMVMLFAGLRRGEMMALRWDCVDLENKTITVKYSVETAEQGAVLKEGGKTDNAERVIDIPQVLADFLKNTERKSDFVCPSAHNKMMNRDIWRRTWGSYLNVLNFKYGEFPKGYKKPTSRFAPEKIPFVIPHITAHWLRHTFITMMYHAGVDVLTAKEQAGHSEISTTLDIYTHLDKTFKRKEMNKLDAYIDKTQQSNRG